MSGHNRDVLLSLAALFILLLFCGLLMALYPLFTHPVSGADHLEVIATAYTCDPHPNNPMTSHPGMCKVTRWGGSNVGAPGMACPERWKLSEWEVPGYGVLTCDDTMRKDLEVYRGLPHIDIRVGTYEAALWVNRNGGEVMVIRPAHDPITLERPALPEPVRGKRSLCNIPEGATAPSFHLTKQTCNMDTK